MEQIIIQLRIPTSALVRFQGWKKINQNLG